ASTLDDVKPGWDRSSESQAAFLECLAQGRLPQSLLTCLRNRLLSRSIVGFIPRFPDLDSSRLSHIFSILDHVDPSWHDSDNAQEALGQILFASGIAQELLEVVQAHVTQEIATSEAVKRATTC